MQRGNYRSVRFYAEEVNRRSGLLWEK